MDSNLGAKSRSLGTGCFLTPIKLRGLNWERGTRITDYSVCTRKGKPQ